MTDIGMFIWHTLACPLDRLLPLCSQYHIKRVAIKVLNGSTKFDIVNNNDKPLLDYMAALRAAGVVVEGWGYHYPEFPGPQGDAIEERREKLGFTTYHVDIEGEWQKPYGMPAAIKTLLSKPKVNNFEMLICSYRYPSLHPQVPWDAAMNHEATNGASPQVYWALQHNPAEQLNKTFGEYAKWNKPLYPVGAMFGASFRSGDTVTRWEPSQEDIQEYMTWCEMHRVPRVYFWSMDYVMSKGRYDWLEAANWTAVPPIPPDPTPEPDEILPIGSFKVTSAYRNLRGVPMGDVIGNAQRNSELSYIAEEGDWKLVQAWIWKAANE